MPDITRHARARHSLMWIYMAMGLFALPPAFGARGDGAASGAAIAADLPQPPAPPALEAIQDALSFDGALPGSVLVAIYVPRPAADGARLERKLNRLLASGQPETEFSAAGLAPLLLSTFLGAGSPDSGLISDQDDIYWLYAADNGKTAASWLLPGHSAESVMEAWRQANRQMDLALGHFHDLPAAQTGGLMDLLAARARTGNTVPAAPPRVPPPTANWMIPGAGAAGAVFTPDPIASLTSRVNVEGPEEHPRYRSVWPDGRSLVAWSAEPGGAAMVTAGEPAPWMGVGAADRLPVPGGAASEGDIHVFVDLQKIRREVPSWLDFRLGALMGEGAAVNLGRALPAAFDALLSSWRGLSIRIDLGGDGLLFRVEGWPAENANRAPGAETGAGDAPHALPHAPREAAGVLDALPTESVAIVYTTGDALRSPAAALFLREALGAGAAPGAPPSPDALRTMAVRLATLEAASREAREMALAWVPDRDEAPHALFVLDTGDAENAQLLGRIATSLINGAMALPIGERLGVMAGPRANRLAERLERDWRWPRPGADARWRGHLALLDDAPSSGGFALLYPGDALRSAVAAVENRLHATFLGAVAGRLATVRLAAPRSAEPIAAAWGPGPDGRPALTFRLPDAMFREVLDGAVPLVAVMRAAVQYDMQNVVFDSVRSVFWEMMR